MNVTIMTADGKKLDVNVLATSDPKADEKIQAFIEKHAPHKIVEHVSHSSSTVRSYVREHGEWVAYPAVKESRWETSYEILECSECNATQDITNGDFILHGVNVSNGENPLEVLYMFLREENVFGKLQVIKALRVLSEKNPQLFVALGYPPNSVFGSTVMLGLSQAKEISEKLLGM